ncbi:MAG: signal recognition particle-docking protein FtsY [Actinomycetota bacterium]
MARSWQELFITDDALSLAPVVEEVADGPSDEPRGRFARLRDNLRKTRQALAAEVGATLQAGDLDQEGWERLEEALIAADVGVATTAEVVARLERDANNDDLSSPEALNRRLIELLVEVATVSDASIDLRPEPTVILVVGVNGTGKTTSIGKLAWHLQQELAKKVVIGAADTFRAAAAEQLEEWAKRAGADIVIGPPGGDPGAVAFETITRARSTGADVAIIDTAGRLHTQADLMAELAKIRRVIAKQLPGAPHETLLTIDATTGQNGVRQAQLFAEAVAVDGIILTKLDGTAKGGIALAIARELGIAVKLIGVGEALEDLRPFDADEFARALLA